MDRYDGELAGRQQAAVKAATFALRAAPWVVFGPISGFCCDRAYQAAQKGHPVLAVLYIVANCAILWTIPSLTYLVTQFRPH